MRGRHGDKAGTRAFIEVLLLLRKHPREVVECAVDYALEVGTADPGTVALIVTQIIAPSPREALVLDVGELSRYDRSPSGVSAYDALLEEEEA